MSADASKEVLRRARRRRSRSYFPNSCSSHRTAFLDVLPGAAMRQAGLAPAVAQLQALDRTRLTELASRPGAVAWQRAMASAASGRTVYAVDGSPVIPDGAYLRFLTAQVAGDLADLEVGADDPWLRIPFGSAIVFEAQDVAVQARSVVEQSLEIIRRWRPALAGELRHVCRAIQFVRDPAAHPDKIVSFSDNAVPGALFVSVMQARGLIDPYDLADSLIHEHRHQKLYLLERLFPMVEPTTMKVVSPWRDDLRPPSGLLHAVFVFVELRRFWEHVRDAGPARLHTRAVNQLQETDARLEEGLRTLERCPLTLAGRALASVLDKAREREAAAA
jgi:uncharacterized protein